MPAPFRLISGPPIDVGSKAHDLCAGIYTVRVWVWVWVRVQVRARFTHRLALAWVIISGTLIYAVAGKATCMAAAEIRINWQVHCANKLHSRYGEGTECTVHRALWCTGNCWGGAVVLWWRGQTHIKQVPGLLLLLMQMWQMFYGWLRLHWLWANTCKWIEATALCSGA